MRVAVLGGGIAGLACAYYAQRAGLSPTVFEATQRLGRLSERFSAGSHELDCFHLPLARQDLALCGLLAELGCLHRVVWREVKTEVYSAGRVRHFDAAEFPPRAAFTGLDRLRSGLASLACSRWLHPEAELHRVPANVWLTRYYGSRTYERVWAPMLRARYGEDAEQMPAFIVWRVLRRLLAEPQELAGYLVGGHAALASRLRDTLERRQPGTVRLADAVQGVQIEGEGMLVSTDGGAQVFDAVISTLNLTDLAKIASPMLLSSLRPPSPEPRGVVSAVALLRRPLPLPYRIMDLDGSLGFEQVVSASQLVPSASLGPLAPVYLVRHSPVHEPPYAASDAELRSDVLVALSRLTPSFSRDEVESIQIFRAPHVEPVWQVGPAGRPPPVRVARSPLYLCTMAQAYPRQPGSEAAVVLARETVRRLRSGFSAVTEGAPRYRAELS